MASQWPMKPLGMCERTGEILEAVVQASDVEGQYRVMNHVL
jgi:hypothetical protein